LRFTQERFTWTLACGELTASNRSPLTHIMTAHDAHCVRSWGPQIWYGRGGGTNITSRPSRCRITVTQIV